MRCGEGGAVRGFSYTWMECNGCHRDSICFFDLCADCRAAAGLPTSIGGDGYILLGGVAVAMWLAIWAFVLLSRA